MTVIKPYLMLNCVFRRQKIHSGNNKTTLKLELTSIFLWVMAIIIVIYYLIRARWITVILFYNLGESFWINHNVFYDTNMDRTDCVLPLAQCLFALLIHFHCLTGTIFLLLWRWYKCPEITTMYSTFQINCHMLFHHKKYSSLSSPLHPHPSLGGIVYLHKAGSQAPSAITLPDICLLSVWINSWVSQTLHQHRCSTKTSMPCWIYQAQQTVISVVGSSYPCLFRGG